MVHDSKLWTSQSRSSLKSEYFLGNFAHRATFSWIHWVYYAHSFFQGTILWRLEPTRLDVLICPTALVPRRCSCFPLQTNFSASPRYNLMGSGTRRMTQVILAYYPRHSMRGRWQPNAVFVHGNTNERWTTFMRLLHRRVTMFRCAEKREHLGIAGRTAGAGVPSISGSSSRWQKGPVFFVFLFFFFWVESRCAVSGREPYNSDSGSPCIRESKLLGPAQCNLTPIL